MPIHSQKPSRRYRVAFQFWRWRIYQDMYRRDAAIQMIQKGWRDLKKTWR